MPRRIAIVEDDPVIGANYADVLKKHGYEVIQHANRPDALAAMRTRLPDLVLLDSVITSRVNTKDDIYDSLKTFFIPGK